MTQSKEIKNLLAALVEVQSELPTMPKNSQAYGYKYADLDLITQTIKPILKKHKIGYTQSVGYESLTNKQCLTTRIFNTEGEYIEDTAVLPVIDNTKNNAAQTLGMSITYMRRYALCAMLGITSDEDTDANPQGNQPKNNAPQKKWQASGVKPNYPVQLTDEQSEEMRKMFAGDLFTEEEKNFYRKECASYCKAGNDPANFVERVRKDYQARLDKRSKEWAEQKKAEAVAEPKGAESQPEIF